MHAIRTVRLAAGAVATLATVAVVAAGSSGGGPAAGPGPARDLVITVDSGSGSTDAPIVAPSSTQARQVAHEPRRAPVMTTAALAHLDIPVEAVGAYRTAAAVLHEVDPGCGLSWTLLAAIGRVESDHGRYAGATLGSDGVSAPLIRGVALDGSGPVARVHDTDAGTVDGDRRWDRAVGPMQFLPSTWAAVGVDADGDGRRSADDLDDAALGAAVFLCAAPGDLDTRSGRRTAVLRYNPSTAYARDVLAAERAYRAGDYALPVPTTYDDGPLAVRALGPLTGPATPTAPAPSGPETAGTEHGVPHAEQVGPGPGHGPTNGPAAGPSTEPTTEPTTGPTEGPTDGPGDAPNTEAPDPTPDPTNPTTELAETVELTGTLQACGTEDEPAWCMDDTVLDVGDDDLLAATALADFDADGSVETNAEELAGLADTEVTVTLTVPATNDEDPELVAIGADAYRSDPPAEPEGSS
ncbi:MAG: lytic transglycosylase domain-containing protein [Nocardioides sp.]|nr:lytic transglycosylase domain-containing protein [Nocardioides sp.]